ncbi:MAG: hypothetical protein JW709_10395 [Sedimentisphaerales bacterium]|nr:hypothetical protein [Sedimentisphaerales bacterium]
MADYLQNIHVVDSTGIYLCDIHIRNGRVYFENIKQQANLKMDFLGKYAFPGMVDIHFHGMKQFDFTSGRYDAVTAQFDDSRESLIDGLDMLRRELPAHGVTGFYVATQAQETDYLQQRLTALGDYMAAVQPQKYGARLWGALLEGTFINPVAAGAQNSDLVMSPDIGIFDKLNRRGMIRLANVVPDFDEASYSLIRHLSRQGVVVGAGHTIATGDQVKNAVAAGLRYCLHFTNGAMSGSYKPFDGGGSIEAVLRDDTLYAEIIADGFHIAPAYVRDILARKGFERVIGVTDAMFAAQTELERIKWVGMEARVNPKRQYIGLTSQKNILAGSLLMMNKAVENILNWLTMEMTGIWTRQHPALTLDNALMATARMYADNPCRLTGLGQQGYGRLTNGGPADFCVLNIQGEPGKYHVQVEQTFVDGVAVFDHTMTETHVW